MDSLQEILVTATKREESLQKIPISVTAVTGRDLEDRNAVNFDDYARAIPDLSFTDLGNGRERISIRGVDSKFGQAVVGYYFGAMIHVISPTSTESTPYRVHSQSAFLIATHLPMAEHCIQAPGVRNSHAATVVLERRSSRVASGSRSASARATYQPS
jgi:hypothetical protein